MSLPGVFEPESFLRRLFPRHGMDRESAVWQFTHMYLRPSSVRRLITTHKIAKGRWGREDPSFLLIETAAVAAIAFLWFLTPATPYRLATLVRALLTFVAFDFLAVALSGATIVWLCVNKWGRKPAVHRATDEDVEWAFCLDVFCNSFVAIIVDIDLGFFAIAILQWLSSRWVVRVFLPNTLLFFGAVHFVVLAVPLMLVPPLVKRFGIVPFLAPLLAVYAVSLLCSVEGGSRWFAFHFGA
jgi:hypothetical protein